MPSDDESSLAVGWSDPLLPVPEKAAPPDVSVPTVACFSALPNQLVPFCIGEYSFLVDPALGEVREALACIGFTGNLVCI